MRESSKARAAHHVTLDAKRARALVKLSSAQCDLGAFDAALAPALEAITLVRSLTPLQPDTFQPDLAAALELAGRAQSALGQHDAALIHVMEAMDTYRGLAKSHPEEYLPRFALTLNQLSICLRHLGRMQEALPVARNALEWLWPYYERFPEVHRQAIRTMFGVLIDLHEQLGSRIDALWARRFEELAARETGQSKKAASPTKIGPGKKARGRTN